MCPRWRIYCPQPTLRSAKIELIESLTSNNHRALDLIGRVSQFVLIMLKDMAHESGLLGIKFARLVLTPSR